MAQQGTTPRTNVSEQALPWATNTIAVAVEHDTFEANDSTMDRQVGHALSFYATGANGTVPGNLSFERTAPRHADIIVTNSSQRCSISAGSKARMTGQNLDQDAALEYYTRGRICLAVDGEAAGWHTGYWLGTTMGLSRSELAPVFRNASYEERRGEWWRDSGN
jgi:hypothetical protein